MRSASYAELQLVLALRNFKVAKMEEIKIDGFSRMSKTSQFFQFLSLGSAEGLKLAEYFILVTKALNSNKNDLEFSRIRDEYFDGNSRWCLPEKITKDFRKMKNIRKACIDVRENVLQSLCEYWLPRYLAKISPNFPSLSPNVVENGKLLLLSINENQRAAKLESKRLRPVDILRKRPHTTPTSDQNDFLAPRLGNRLASADRFGRSKLRSPDSGSDSGYDEGPMYSKNDDQKYRSKLLHFIKTLRNRLQKTYCFYQISKTVCRVNFFINYNNDEFLKGLMSLRQAHFLHF